MPVVPSFLRIRGTTFPPAFERLYVGSWTISEADLPTIKRARFLGRSISENDLKDLWRPSTPVYATVVHQFLALRVAEGLKWKTIQEMVLDVIGIDRYKSTRSTAESKAASCAPRLDTLEHKHENGTESWKVLVVASSRRRSPPLLATDVISTVDFNEDGELFATGGMARKIRICSYTKMIRDTEGMQRSFDEEQACFSDDDEDDNDEGGSDIVRRSGRSSSSSVMMPDHAVNEICTPGKLSSLKWRPNGSDVIGCGDYDGVVSEWSIDHGHTVSERYEHSGQRVWSLDYSKLAPTLSASSSADGTVRLWSRETEKSVAILKPQKGNSAICCAEFSPAAQHLIAVASADAHVYLQDLRRPDSLLLRLTGHDKTVSYVRFLGSDNLVSASVDSTLKLWDISASSRGREHLNSHFINRWGTSDEDAHLVRTFTAHTNVRNFVGLSVHRGPGLFICGSETDEVFFYRYSSTIPLVRHKFPRNRPHPGSGACAGALGKSFVGAVCWREQGPDYSLVAANSEGVVQVLQAKKP